MPPKIGWIFKEATANGILEGKTKEQRQSVYARMATGRSPFVISNPNKKLEEKQDVTYYNLGRVKGDDLPFDMAGEDEHPRSIAQGRLLLGTYDDSHEPATHTDLKLERVHFWNINGPVIGDVAAGRKVPKLSEGFGWQGRFRRAKSVVQLHSVLQPAIEKGDTDIAEAIPGLPSYANKKYVQSGPQAQTEGPVHVAVRFVNRLDLQVEFPVATELIFETSHSFDEVLYQLDQKIRDWADKGRTSLHKALREFFAHKALGSWGWVVWVLPQGDGQDKLQMYQSGCLGQFLKAEEVDGNEGERLLYMEAHLMAIEKVSEPRGTKR